jgi:hypothetical protein
MIAVFDGEVPHTGPDRRSQKSTMRLKVSAEQIALAKKFSVIHSSAYHLCSVRHWPRSRPNDAMNVNDSSISRANSGSRKCPTAGEFAG